MPKLEILRGFHSGAMKSPEKTTLYLTMPADERWDEEEPQHEVFFVSASPLHITTGEQLKDLWEACGELPHLGPLSGHAFHPHHTTVFTDLVRGQGYDAIVVHPEAVAIEGTEHDEYAWEWGAGTFGEPQIIVLEPSRIKRPYEHWRS